LVTLLLGSQVDFMLRNARPLGLRLLQHLDLRSQGESPC
jgi:hypothetical protein